MISEVHFHCEPDGKYWLCVILTEDGDYLSFWSRSSNEALARASWIREAYDAPFQIDA